MQVNFAGKTFDVTFMLKFNVQYGKGIMHSISGQTAIRGTIDINLHTRHIIWGKEIVAVIQRKD